MAEQSADSTQTCQFLELLREGRPGAADGLLARHRRYLRQLIALRLDPQMRARVDPSDIVQEAQMEAVRRLEGYLARPQLPFRLWLRQIAHDRLIMARRRHVGAAIRTTKRDVPERSSFALAEQLLASKSGPSERLRRSELVHRVHQAIANLGESDREILLMRNFESLSNQEVAQVLDITPTAASQRCGRALLRLRKQLLADGAEELP